MLSTAQAQGPEWSADGGHRAMVTVAEGVRFSIEIGTGPEADDGISRTLAVGEYPAEYRPLVRELIGRVPPGGRILDLGAHIGVCALAAAAAGYEVVAVEASPRNVALLRSSATRNGFDRMRVIHAGVGDRTGTLKFCPFGPYGHVISPTTEHYTEIEVPAVMVDDLLRELGWDRVDFIKMDIEGSEVAAIRGMERLLARADAPPIFYESNRHTLGFFGWTPSELKAALERFGYRNYRIEADGLVPVQSSDDQAETVVDYLALKG